jgi:hypothetical protein
MILDMLLLVTIPGTLLTALLLDVAMLCALTQRLWLGQFA